MDGFCGARVSYRWPGVGLFFRSTGRLNKKAFPPRSGVQGIWIAVFDFFWRTRHVDAAAWSRMAISTADLLDYVVFSVLIFYCRTLREVLSCAREAARRRTARPRGRVSIVLCSISWWSLALWAMCCGVSCSHDADRLAGVSGGRVAWGLRWGGGGSLVSGGYLLWSTSGTQSRHARNKMGR